MLIRYYNARVIRENKTEDLCVLTKDGTIVEICARSDAPADETVDCGGNYLAPGFADLHVHGGGGFSAMGNTPAEILGMCRAHLKHGVTSILPTALAAPVERLQRAVDVISAAKEQSKDCNILGVHLEGPFLSPKKAGAQKPENLLLPTEENILGLLDYSKEIRLIGAAPELPGGMRLGEEAAKRGIVASVAHSDADFSVAEEALFHGYSDITHIFSASSAMHKEGVFRQVGVAEAGLALDGYTAQFIGDLRHLPRGAIKLILKAKGADKAYLITDGLEFAGCGLPNGTEVIQENGQAAVIEDGVMKLADRSCLAGSIATMDGMVKNLVEICGVSLPDAVRCASTTPLRVIGYGDRKGKTQPGYDADMILFDDQIRIHRVIVSGKTVNFRT